jgi:hypothetical protein
LTNDGAGNLTWAPGGGGGLTVGTTAIASGVVGRILFEGAGNILQESANLFWDNTAKTLTVSRTNSGALGGEIYLKNDAVPAVGNATALRFLASNASASASSAFIDTNHPVTGDLHSSELVLHKWDSQLVTLVPTFYWDLFESSGNPVVDEGRYGINVHPLAPFHVRQKTGQSGSTFISECVLTDTSTAMLHCRAAAIDRALIVVNDGLGPASFSYLSLNPRRSGVGDGYSTEHRAGRRPDQFSVEDWDLRIRRTSPVKRARQYGIHLERARRRGR